MKSWYNGHSWDGKTFVYNPFSVLNFFEHRAYRNFWFARALNQNKLAEAIAVVNNLIQSVPDQNYIKSEEKFFHAIVHLMFTMIGSDPRSEMHAPTGSMDTVIITNERIFRFEFKVGGTAEEAIQCIKDRN
jgi:hypothetical protein